MTSFEEHPLTSSTKEEGGKLNTINNSDNSHDSTSHSLSDTWILWAHLPHDTDWSIRSYTKIYEFNTLEQAVTITEMLPPKLIVNCMLFLMRKGINPIWEQEPMNMLAKNNQLYAHKFDGFWHAMDTLRDKNYLEDLWTNKKALWKSWDE